MNKLILMLMLFCFSLIPSAGLSDQETVGYTCTVVWIVGAQKGEGATVDEAVNDAKRKCDLARQGPGKCSGGPPQDIECEDSTGKCLSSVELLKMGYTGGRSCGQ